MRSVIIQPNKKSTQHIVLWPVPVLYLVLHISFLNQNCMMWLSSYFPHENKRPNEVMSSPTAQRSLTPYSGLSHCQSPPLSFLVVRGGGCPVLCGLFSSTPALYPLDASSKPHTSHYTSYPLPLPPIPPRILFRFPPSPPTIMKTKNVTRQCKMSLGGKITSGWNYWHRNMCSFLNLFSLYCVILPNEIAPFWLIKVSRSPQF